MVPNLDQSKEQFWTITIEQDMKLPSVIQWVTEWEVLDGWLYADCKEPGRNETTTVINLKKKDRIDIEPQEWPTVH